MPGGPEERGQPIQRGTGPFALEDYDLLPECENFKCVVATAAEEYLEKGKPAEALKYAGKAMDVAESLEAEQDRCPKCKAETKPRWLLCPKCGQPLR